MPHGRHIYSKVFDMAKSTICAYPQYDHTLQHWKCVLRCCADCPCINIPDLGPVASKHGNLYTTAKCRYYGTREYVMPRATEWSRNGGRKGNGTAGGTEGTDQQDRERTRNGERGGRRRQGGQRGAEEKRQPLVGSATEYQEFYGGGSAD